MGRQEQSRLRASHKRRAIPDGDAHHPPECEVPDTGRGIQTRGRTVRPRLLLPTGTARQLRAGEHRAPSEQAKGFRSPHGTELNIYAALADRQSGHGHFLHVQR